MSKHFACYKRGWIFLALGVLVVPGLAAIILVLLRSLQLNSSQWQQVFNSALVLHVDLSIYAWMLVVFALMLSMKADITKTWEISVLYLGTLAMSLIVLSTFVGSPEVVLSNYIPVIDSVIFFTGLIIFTLSMAVFFISLFYKSSLGFGIRITFILYLFAVFIVFHSGFALGGFNSDNFELIFWGGGHVFQLVITMLMMMAWVILAEKSCKCLLVNNKLLNFLYALMLVCGFYALYIHMAYPPTAPEYRTGMTWMMQWGNSIAPVILGLALIWRLGRPKLTMFREFYLPVFYLSFLMFMTGGFIGVMISGNNTIIPAHYHGSIVGVTLALMGLIYHYLSELGYARVKAKLAWWQSGIYTLGQLMHIAGLVLIGSLGAARKVVSNLHAVESLGTILVRFGGLAAVLGGVLFIVVVVLAMRSQSGSVKACG